MNGRAVEHGVASASGHIALLGRTSTHGPITAILQAPGSAGGLVMIGPMPAVSEAQRRYLNATKGHSWVKAHHFDNAGKLPSRVHPRREALRRMRRKRKH